MTPKLKKVLIWVGYPAFYLFCFLIFAYLTFPYEHLRDRIVAEFTADQRKTGGNMRLEIDSVTSYWLSGIDARGVRLIQPGSGPEGLRKPTEIAIDRLTVRVSILPLIIGRVTLNASAQMLGGSIDASTSKKGEERHVEAEFSNLAVGSITPLVEMVGMPMSGELSGKLNLTLPEGKLSKTNGTIRVGFADYAVGDGKTKIKDMIALPKMNIGELTFECDVKDGIAKITKFAAAGMDLDFSADGKLTMRDPFADSQADMYMRFKFADGYKTRNETTKNLFGSPGSNIPPAIEMMPAMKSSKRPDGFYSWHVWGLLKNLRYDPAPAGGSSASPGAPGPIRGGFKP